jgi:hypothetical protein
MMLYSVSRRPAIDNPRLVRTTVGCGTALSVIALTSCLVYGIWYDPCLKINRRLKIPLSVYERKLETFGSSVMLDRTPA